MKLKSSCFYTSLVNHESEYTTCSLINHAAPFLFLQPPPRTSELPSIDDELAEIFSDSGSPSPGSHKDYSREPLSGSKAKVRQVPGTNTLIKKQRQSYCVVKEINQWKACAVQLCMKGENAGFCSVQGTFGPLCPLKFETVCRLFLALE